MDVFWTFIQYFLTVRWIMRRTLKIHIVFEPSRLGTEQVRNAYEMLVPVNRRPIHRADAEVEPVGRARFSKRKAEKAS